MSDQLIADPCIVRCIFLNSSIALVFAIVSFETLTARPESAIYPHRQSSFDYRVTNRKSISHILYENRDGQHYVTLITSHGGVWAFHSSSHALHYPCVTIKNCMQELTKLDKFLKSGWNIGLHLRGSLIQRIVYHPRP